MRIDLRYKLVYALIKDILEICLSTKGDGGGGLDCNPNLCAESTCALWCC